MTKSFSNTPLWPYVGVVACLLILAVLAPRTWKQDVIDSPRRELTSAPPTIAGSSIQSPTVVEPTHPAVSQETFVVAQVATSPLLALGDFPTQRQAAPVSPPVTEQLEFDPSVGDLPSLPSPDATPELPHVAIAPRLSPPAASLSISPLNVVKQPAESAPRVSTSWPLPRDLMTRLEQVAELDDCRPWVDRVRFTLEQLHRTDSLFASSVTEYLNNLDSSVHDGTVLANSTTNNQAKSKILRANYALARRVEIWKQVHKIMAHPIALVSIQGPDDSRIRDHLKVLDQQLTSLDHGPAWRQYLLLKELNDLVGSGQTDNQHRLARQILLRMESTKLNDAQLAVMKKSPFVELSRELRRWADEPVNYRALLDDVEAYEENRRADGARSIARQYQNARWSSNPAIEDLGDLLNAHYRNANLRVAVAADLLNRLIPPIEPLDQDVNENILGARVYGVSRIHTELRAILIPDTTRWRVGVEARGRVESSTAANSGPATFYNDALSRYLARKLMIVDRNGISVRRAEAEANSDTGLTGFRTDFDRVPVIGWLARSIALDQHDSRLFSARREAEERLAARASERLDDEVHQRLEQAERDFDTKLLQPMQRLQLNPVALDLQTTKSRLIGRYRLAGGHQVGAHTPRPQAPSDSLLSVQLHESALNNVLEQLQLEGKQSDLRQLYRDLGEIFANPGLEAPEDVPEGVTITFADDEAVRIRCEQGRVIVTLRIAELKRGWRHQWHNFAVRAYYVPDRTQLDANLVREGAIELDGQHITSYDRIALSGVFSKTLSRNRPFNLINKHIAESENLQDLQVTQFVVAEGWIGVALGPQYGGSLQETARQPQAESDVR